jgi:hypothetical protein
MTPFSERQLQINTRQLGSGGSAMDKRRSIILLEFNELTPSLVSRFIAEGKLPNFERLYNESRVFTTDASEDAAENSRLLNPWVQWVTVHTGVSAQVHGIRKLGEAAQLKQKSLTQVLTAAGRRVLIFGTMNVKHDGHVDGCVVPDPWTRGTDPYPMELTPFYRFIQKTVQDHTSGEEQLTRAEYAAFLRFMVTHGLSLSTVMAIAGQLASELRRRYGWRRVAILDRIQWDVFRYYYRRVRPHFATFFLNSTAHLQHKFWRNMDPEPFKIRPSAGEQAELQNAVLFGYQQMDRLLGRMMALAGTDSTLVLCTALSQQPCLIYEDSGGKTFYRARNIDEVLQFAGLTDPYTYSPVMSEEFHLIFDDDETAARAMHRLCALTVDGEQAFAATRDGARLFCGCRIIRQLPPDAVLESGEPASRVKFFDLFHQGGGIKSGMHHPDGMLWIRLPDRSHAVAREKVELSAVAPTLLRLLDVAPPHSMQARPLIGSRHERFDDRLAVADMRRVS